MCSRRRKAPSVPASLQRSASASNRRFSLPENWRRLAIATTSGSRRAPSPEAISPAPSATASEPDNPFREDFTNEVMFVSTCTLNCPRQVSHLTLARGGATLFRLGDLEGGTERYDEAIVAFREALKERTRKWVPLQWAVTQGWLASALQRLGEREIGTTRLEQ